MGCGEYLTASLNQQDGRHTRLSVQGSFAQG